MLRNAVKMLTRNLGLKLLALLFAVAMWMAVVNLEDPVINKRFTVAVTVENDEVITAMNKYYEIEAESANVTFSVLGSRSVVDTLSSLDFKATADMSQLIQKEDGNVVPVEITALRHDDFQAYQGAEGYAGRFDAPGIYDSAEPAGGAGKGICAWHAVRGAEPVMGFRAEGSRFTD